VGRALLRRRRTSLSWRGRRRAPRKTDGDVAAGPPPCRTSPRVMGHPCDRDEAAMETMKAEAGEGDRRRKAGQSVYLKVLEAQMIYWLTTTRRQWRSAARSIWMKNSLLFPF
jgi:hypothetical protein